MTPRMKATLVVAAMLGLVSGAAVGYKQGSWSSSGMEEAYLMTGDVLSKFAGQQLRHADTDHARRAVMIEIKFLELASKARTARDYDGSLGFAYTRLALVEQAAGRPEAEHAALDQAKAYFKRNYPQHEPTDEQMKELVKKIDDASDRM